MDNPQRDDEDKIAYREAMGFRIFALLMILLIALYVVVFAAGVVKRNTASAILFGIMMAVLIAVYINFRKLVFEITAVHVKIRFGLIEKKIERSRIISCEEYKLTFPNYLGYGIRYGRDRTKAYNTRNGTGVKLEVDGEKRPIVVSLDDPGEVCRLLNTRGKPDEA